MICAMTGRPVAVAIQAFVAWQDAVERRQQVGVGTGADLDDHEAGRGVRHEDRQQPVPAGRRSRSEPCAVLGEIDEPATVPRPDRQFARLYGKMFRMASRSRPMPPPAGADS
jgi:hypothetical protein